MKKPFLLIIGESGSGKTAVAEALEKEYGMKQVQSYTNRPKRSDKESGHIFLTEKNISKIKAQYPNRVADTIYDKYLYFTTVEQIEECDTYVISPDAIPMFKANYKGKKKIVVVYIRVPPFLRIARMSRRGDAEEAIVDRITFDEVAFKDAESVADLVVRNFVLTETIDTILDYLKKRVK